MMRRKSGRKRKSIDYVKFNEGDGLVIKNGKHPHIQKMMNYYDCENECTRKRVKRKNNEKVLNKREFLNYYNIDGTQLTQEFANKYGFNIPIWVRKENGEGTGMKVPENLIVSEVEKSMGETHKIDVMDVMSQEGLKNWTMKDWKEYFETNGNSERDRTLNVISLEVSKTSLNNEIRRPKIVEDLDIIDKSWPARIKKQRKSVAKYCLMSVKNCYTDYHLDFAGTQVYYKVIKGSKWFSFIPPTSHNLKSFTKWSKLKDQNQVFFPEFLQENSKRKGNKTRKKTPEEDDDQVYKDVSPGGFNVMLKEGDLLMIPSGWIHAVYTPEDSIVIGGNFLTLASMGKQLDIAEVEAELHVEPRYLFPDFRKSMWFVAKYCLDNEVGINSPVREENSKKFTGKEVAAVVQLWERFLKKDSNAKELHISKLLGGSVDQFSSKFEEYVTRLRKIQHDSQTCSRC